MVFPPAVPAEGKQVSMSGQALAERPVDGTQAAVYLFVLYDPIEGRFDFLGRQPKSPVTGPRLKIVARSSAPPPASLDEWSSTPDFSAKEPDLGDLEFFTE
jgi:hypothetical protein